jgi:hypothetical protein
MGSNLVIEAATKFADVGYDAYRVLVHMAVHSLDTENGEQKARRYFGGQETLARAMRPELPPEEDPSDEAKKAWTTALRDLARAMEMLVITGAVTRTVANPKPGDRQVWDLTLRRKAPSRTPEMDRRKAREAARRKARKEEIERLRAKKTDGVVPHPKDGVVPQANGWGSAPPAAWGSAPSLGATKEPLEEKRKEPCGEGRSEPDRSARAREASETESHLVLVPDPDTAAEAHEVLARRHDLGVPYVIQAEDEIGKGHPRAVYEVRAVELLAAGGRRTG